MNDSATGKLQVATFPNPATQFQPGESGNPNGRPKGSKNLSRLIRELIEDEETDLILDKETKLKYPGKVIVTVMIGKAAKGDVKAADWIGRFGYGTKVDVTSGDEPIKPGDTINLNGSAVDAFVKHIKNDTSAVQTSTD